jgi:hypothetical protein
VLVSDPPYFEGGVVEETIQKIVSVFVSIAQTAQIVKPFLQKIFFSCSKIMLFSRKKILKKT